MPFIEVHGDAAGSGPRRFLFWRPPLLGDASANEHESVFAEASAVFAEALRAGYSGILFGRARVSVERMLLDVRRDSEYTGVEVRAKHGGHVPGAVNVLWKDALRDDWLLKDPEELEQMYIDAGFGPETATVTYCQSGVRAAFTHLVLTALGHDDVRTYDGSWEEWGNRDDVPIVVGRS